MFGTYEPGQRLFSTGEYVPLSPRGTIRDHNIFIEYAT